MNLPGRNFRVAVSLWDSRNVHKAYVPVQYIKADTGRFYQGISPWRKKGVKCGFIGIITETNSIHLLLWMWCRWWSCGLEKEEEDCSERALKVSLAGALYLLRFLVLLLSCSSFGLCHTTPVTNAI